MDPLAPEPSGIVDTIQQLEALYGSPGNTSTEKVSRVLTPAYQTLISAAPLFALATVGPEGLDCSPRGDAAGHNSHGAVHIADERTLLVPDRRGNNRLDSLRNIVRDPRIALLFFIPGSGTTVRVNGDASISAELQLLQRFAVDGKRPRTVVIVTVREVYFQCARAIVRSDFWNANKHIDPSRLPTPGQLLEEALGANFDGEAYDDEWPVRAKRTLW